MTSLCEPDFFARYQTFIVGVLGFTGVMLTLWWNARQARRQREAVIEHDRTSVRRALLEQLKFLKLSFEDRDRTMGEAEKDGSDAFLVPTDTMTDAYHRLIDRIGLLTAEQAAKAIQAYLAVRQMPAKLRLMEDTHLSGDLARDWIRVDKKRFADVRAMHHNHAGLIDDAIRALEEGS